MLGPGDTWPSPKKPYWRKPLDQARDAGWSFDHVDAPHTLGWAWCPAGEHSFMVDQTANGAEFHAVEASKEVTQRCRHGSSLPGSKVKQRQQQVQAHLATIDRLLDGCEHDIAALEEAGAAWERALALESQRDAILLRLETASRTAEAVLAGVSAEGDDDHDVAAVEEQMAAELELVDEMEPLPDGDALRQTLTEAEGRMGSVDELARQLRRRPHIADDVRREVDERRQRVESLRTRLDDAERRATDDG